MSEEFSRANGRTLLSYTPDLRLFDATIRDGGLMNDFYFEDDFVKALYKANVKAGVDYMEFGYRASKDMFDPEKFGKWKFTSDEDIRAIVGDNDTDLKISIMADAGRTDYKEDIHKCDESPVDIVRVATYIHTIPTAIAMVEDAHEKGYETSVNIMAISKSSGVEIESALELLGQSPVDILYLVDSYGSLYPEQVRRLCDRFLECAEKYGKKVGFHAHNNQQLAFANTTEAIIKGVCYVDGTVSSLGRGAGNCPLELLLGFLKNPKYRIDPILSFIEKEMIPLKESGLKWGYDIPYVLTGILNQHPRTAIQFQKEDRKDYRQFYIDLMDNF
ncbi:MAG: aldolase catalytic domain-containing protein [Lachnospiraceae bacterium]|nr:aldolase catalytic domain-containing protein [Lachnospiraceae bacterium]